MKYLKIYKDEYVAVASREDGLFYLYIPNPFVTPAPEHWKMWHK